MRSTAERKGRGRTGKRVLAGWMAAAMLLGMMPGAVAAGEVKEPPVEELVVEGLTEVTTEAAQLHIEEPGAENADEAAPEAGEVETKGLHFAKDYEEVYEALRSADTRYWYAWDDDLDYAVEESADAAAVTTLSAAPAAAQSKAAAGTGIGTADFSITNLRDAGVDEADIVKTDGAYIYVLQDNATLLIAKAEGADSRYVSVTELLNPDELADGTYERAEDMYVDGDRLVVVASREETRDENGNWFDRYRYTTFAITYDISDPAAPTYLGTVWQEGSYKESRKTGDTIYLYSTEYVSVYDKTYEESLAYIVPAVNGEELAAEDICIPDYVTESSYLLVSSYSLAAPDTLIDSKAMISGADQVYVTTGSLYVMNQNYNSRSRLGTEIVKFSFEDGRIEGKASARVRGYINDTFSIDEYNGDLRVLTTYQGSQRGALLEALGDLFGVYYDDPDRWVRHNALYILDEDLNRRARLMDIARNEEIKSARYFGDTAYFVTFRNTDPLFTADLSDPDAPRLTGELKISGFSSYLHPYGEGLLLGLGYEADEQTGSVSGLKLSMFDVSEPTDVKEIDRFVVRGITWCPALEDYKAILANGEKNLIGFFCDNRYMVFRYDPERGFERVLLYDFYEDMLNGTAAYDTMRGLYIGDELYLAGADYLLGFDMADGFTKDLALMTEDSDEQ